MGVVLREYGHARGYMSVPSNATDIPERIKEIDERFFVVLNLKTQLYEVHVEGQAGGTLGCALPYAALDSRAVDYVRKYHCARLEQTLREIESHNARLEASAESAHMDKAGYKMKNALAYLDHHESATALPAELISE